MKLVIVKKVVLVTLFFVINSAHSQTNDAFAQPNNGEAIVSGHVFNVQSQILGSGISTSISVALPHKYNERIQSYPVVYVLEGDYLFDAARSISSFMARRSQMPQSIIVGISAGEYSDRNNMAVKYHGGQPDKYVNFLEEELIPYIEKTYRANSHRTIVGLSPTNGVLFDAFFNTPDLFSGYIALSAHLEWPPQKNTRLIDEVISHLRQPDYPESTLYMGRADSDLAASQAVQNAFNDAQDKLDKVHHSNAVAKIDVLKDEEHYVMSLTGLRRGFQLIYPLSGSMFPAFLSSPESPANAVKEEYQRRSDAYSFDVYPVEDGHNPNDHLSGLIDILDKKKQYGQAAEMARLGLSYYPNSANLKMKLALLLQKSGKHQQAITLAEQAIELAQIYHPTQLTRFNHQLTQISKSTTR